MCTNAVKIGFPRWIFDTFDFFVLVGQMIVNEVERPPLIRFRDKVGAPLHHATPRVQGRLLLWLYNLFIESRFRHQSIRELPSLCYVDVPCFRPN
jgi:hypothetical protein